MVDTVAQLNSSVWMVHSQMQAVSMHLQQQIHNISLTPGPQVPFSETVGPVSIVVLQLGGRVGCAAACVPYTAICWSFVGEQQFACHLLVNSSLSFVGEQ